MIPTLLLLTGEIMEQLTRLRIKSNVVHAGPSQLYQQWRVLTLLQLDNSSHSQSNSQSIAQDHMVTMVAMVVYMTTHSTMPIITLLRLKQITLMMQGTNNASTTRTMQRSSLETIKMYVTIAMPLLRATQQKDQFLSLFRPTRQSS